MYAIADRLFYGTMRLEWSYVDLFPIPKIVNVYLRNNPSVPHPNAVKHRVSRGQHQYVIVEDMEEGGDYVFELYEDLTIWYPPRELWDDIYDQAEIATEERARRGEKVNSRGNNMICLGEDGNYYEVNLVAQREYRGKMYHLLMAPKNPDEYASFEIIEDQLGVAYYRIVADSEIQIGIMTEIHGEVERQKAVESADYSAFESDDDSDLF